MGPIPAIGLTLSSAGAPPALPSALSHLPASSAPLSASVQAGLVSFIRWSCNQDDMF
jgi:hypothetical protein